MVLFGLSGDSYIKRLDLFCNGDLHVPGSFTFVYRGGLQLDTLGNEMKGKMKGKMKAAKPDLLFLSVGGNDISPVSDPKKISKGICELVQDFHNAGVRHVCISEILQRADVFKSQSPGLSKSKLRCIDVSTTLFRRHVPAEYELVYNVYTVHCNTIDFIYVYAVHCNTI